MGLSIPHLLLVLVVIFVVFGAGKLPKVMGDVGKGIRNLREGLRADEEPSRPEQSASVLAHDDTKNNRQS